MTNREQDRIKNLREEYIKDWYDWRELELFRRQVMKHLPQTTGVDALEKLKRISEELFIRQDIHIDNERKWPYKTSLRDYAEEIKYIYQDLQQPTQTK